MNCSAAQILSKTMCAQPLRDEVEKGKYTYPPPYLRTTRCTIGISLPLTLYTTISPTCVSSPRFHKNNRSPLWKAGSMDPESTTTMGEGESATTESPFQSMKAVDRTSAKLRTWAASCRGCMAERPSMAAAVLCICMRSLEEVMAVVADGRGSRTRKCWRSISEICRVFWGIDRRQALQDVRLRGCRVAFVVSLMPDVLRFVEWVALAGPSSTPQPRLRIHFHAHTTKIWRTNDMIHLQAAF